MKEKFYYPLWSPNPKGKLFQRFTFSKDIKVGDDEIAFELNNYKNYKNFTWIFESDEQTGTEQPIRGLLSEANYISIRTNSAHEIQKGDIVFLVCSRWKNGKYFIINDDIGITYVTTPNELILSQHLSLQALL